MHVLRSLYKGVYTLSFRYNPRIYYESNAELKLCVDQIDSDAFAPAGTFQHIVDELMNHDR